jgi:glycosyltransferase involved in cell wall biosynthesis
MRRPIVAFDLHETRVTAHDAALYVPKDDERAFATAIHTLLQEPERRRQMGESGRRRVEKELSWQVSSRALVGLYEQFLGGANRAKVVDHVAAYEADTRATADDDLPRS